MSKTNLQTAVEALESIARRSEVAPIEARIAREALAALRQVEAQPQTVSRPHDYTDPKELIGQTPPHIAMRTAPQPASPIPTVEELESVLHTTPYTLRNDHEFGDIPQRSMKDCAKAIHDLLTARLKGAQN